LLRKEKSSEFILIFLSGAEGNKYLCIVVKFKEKDAFVITAYFTDSIKKGEAIWRK